MAYNVFCVVRQYLIAQDVLTVCVLPALQAIIDSMKHYANLVVVSPLDAKIALTMEYALLVWLLTDLTIEITYANALIRTATSAEKNSVRNAAWDSILTYKAHAILAIQLAPIVITWEIINAQNAIPEQN